MPNRYKRSGWFGDSHRHYLAAKGVKTKVDLDKYAGTWKQVAVTNEPWFQKGCENVRAKYTKVGRNSIQVENTCTKNGEKRSVKGLAYPISKNNDKLIVQFGNSIFRTGRYTIVEVNDDYTKATVQGNGDTVWMLEREKNADRYFAVKWKLDDPNQIIEWQDPKEFVKRTHATDIEDVPSSAPNYHDTGLNKIRPARELAQRFKEGAEVEPLKDYALAKNVTILPDGKRSVKNPVVDGRHRAWAAWVTGEKKVPVVVGLKDGTTA